MDKKTFQVPAMGCNGCVRTVTNELLLVDGVTNVVADLDTQTVDVEWGDPANWEKIKSTLVEIEYPPVEA